MDQGATLTAGPKGPALHGDVLQVNVRHRFASGFAVSAAIDAVLAPGAILVLFGPSGAGKTTVLRQIAGLGRPDAGTIRFGDDTWFDSARAVWQPPQRRRVGLVFQEPALFPHLSVRRNLTYGIRAKPDSPPASVSEWGSAWVTDIATTLGIHRIGNRDARELSGGEAQRVALARALAPGPRLMLLDEPFASLDAPTRTRLRREVRSLLRRIGMPAVLVTHDRAEAMAMGDEMAVMIGGRVRQAGGVAATFTHPAEAEIAESLGVEAVLPARVTTSSGGLLTVTVGEVEIRVAERDPMAPGAEVYACIRAEDVTLETPSPGAAARASVRNHLAARVAAVAPEGPIVRVTVDCGFLLDALITRQSREELKLAPGSQVTAAIKATSVHLVPRA